MRLPLLVSFGVAAVAALSSRCAWAQPLSQDQQVGAQQPVLVATDPDIPASVSQRPDLWRRPTSSHPTDSLSGANVVGLHASMTRVRGTDADSQQMGLALGGYGSAYSTSELSTMRALTQFSIGGGTAGLEGSFSGDFAGGLRLMLGRFHGPFTRVGFCGELFGNSALYGSFIEIPTAQLGYQYLQRGRLLELGLRAGPVLVGRYNSGDRGTRKLGSSFEWGGHAALYLPPVRFDLSFSRTQAQSEPGTPVDLVKALVCSHGGLLGICTDLRLYRGDVVLPLAQGDSISEARSMYIGLLVGIDSSDMSAQTSRAMHMEVRY
jgi:hypothetical protein